MNVKDAFDSIPQLEEGYCYFQPLANSVGMPHIEVDDDAFSEGVKKYWVNKWYCTDTWVGVAIYTLHGKPLALSYHSGRKSYETFKFHSDAQVMAFRTFLYSIRLGVEFDNFDVKLFRTEDEIDPAWLERK